MTSKTFIGLVCCAPFILSLVCTAAAQITVYNNFGPEHAGWDYNYGLGWTVAGVNVPGQYGVEQAMGFTSTADGAVSDIWVAFFYVPSSPLPDTVTIKLARNPYGLPPDSAEVMEQWVITSFESWYQWTPPIHLQGSGSSRLLAGEDYWLWAIGGETTCCGWCLNVNPSLTCPHTLRREGENWLAVANETASAFRVDVISAPPPPVTITLTPLNPPIVIPPQGGSFDWNITLHNADSTSQTFDVWTIISGPVTRPGWGPFLNLTLSAGAMIARTRSQYISSRYPPGNYTYTGNIGAYPSTVWDSDSFPFTKAASSDGGWADARENDGRGSEAVTPNECPLLGVAPNPFNPTTILHFELSEASFVRLGVYDVSGRLVAELLDGWRAAGAHEMTFDGSGLAAGVYVARLEAGEYSASQKLVLLK